jgi:hypothetical protein
MAGAWSLSIDSSQERSGHRGENWGFDADRLLEHVNDPIAREIAELMRVQLRGG